MLEVVGLPGSTKRVDLTAVCSNLVQQGAKLQVLGGCGDQSMPDDLSTGTLMAVFDSEASAQRAASCHRSNHYHLRAPTKHYDLTVAEEPS